uniref:Cholinergic receptor muscarinic 3 n=1 Tax=Neolamprologus brichardi TaxID=32507 RepID=A0A3Q4I3V3_NEOBR
MGNSAENRTLMLPPDEFNPLGGHTIWQVTVVATLPAFFLYPLRYFSVTRPLTYRAKRTTKRAMTMIGLAWSISFILWAPAILFWQYIVGERTVQPNECYIQFLSEPIITFCTAIAAFYLPVTIMAILFWKIYQETEKRAKDVQGLKGSGAPNNQNISAAMLHQVRSQKYSSYGLNYLSSEKNNASLPGGIESRGKCSMFCFEISSLLPVHHASKRLNATSPAAEQSSCDSFNNNEAWDSEDQSGSEAEVDARSSKDGKKSRKGKENKEKYPLSTNISPRGSNAATSCSADPSPTAITMKDAAVAKRFASKAKTEISKRKNEKKANEKKAARTLSAILFAFITTWLPYNIMVLVNTFCQDCIPETLWALGYWLCYVNSTVNPMCYALCNKTFRTTFRDILMCQWNQRKNKPHFYQRQAVVFHKKDPM